MEASLGRKEESEIQKFGVNARRGSASGRWGPETRVPRDPKERARKAAVQAAEVRRELCRIELCRMQAAGRGLGPSRQTVREGTPR